MAGTMRLRLTSDKAGGEVSIAYRELKPKKNPLQQLIDSLFYKVVIVKIRGEEKRVEMNIGSLKKHLGMGRFQLRQADQKALQICIRHCAFLGALAKNGMINPEGQKIASHISQHFTTWSAQPPQKGIAFKDHTIHYFAGDDGKGEVFVSLSQRVLGEGGFGRVTKGVAFATGEVVAHKEAVIEEGEEEEEAKKRKEMIEEGKRHELFKGCPNILQALKVGPGGVMLEYMNGGDLSTTDNIHTAAELKEVIVQAIKGVFQLHQKGMVHRDIKPQNFLLRREGGKVVLKLADLGLIKKQGEIDDKSGTFHYISPSRFLRALRKQAVDPADDFFSLGASFFEMIYGDLPHFCIQDKTEYNNIFKTYGTDPVKELEKRDVEVKNKAESLFGDEKPQPGTIMHLITGLLNGTLTGEAAVKAAEALDLDHLKDVMKYL